jgi:adenylosuccinate synthase
MSVMIVVGGGRGGEGKGKLVAYLALADQVVLAVRACATYEHYVEWGGQRHSLSHLPCAFVHQDTRLLIGPGRELALPGLVDEIERLGVGHRLGIDPLCRVAEPEAQARETPILEPFLSDVPLELHTAARRGQAILVEGGAGFQATGVEDEGDSTAQACCVELGLGPTHVTDVLVVLPSQLGHSEPPRTGLALGQPPRLTDFDLDLAQRLVLVNGATAIALSALDKRFGRVAGVQRRQNLPPDARQFIDTLEDVLNLSVALVSTGPGIEQVIDLR